MTTNEEVLVMVDGTSSIISLMLYNYMKFKDPKAVMKHKMGLFHKDHSEAMIAFFNSGTKTLGEEVANWPEISPR